MNFKELVKAKLNESVRFTGTNNYEYKIESVFKDNDNYYFHSKKTDRGFEIQGDIIVDFNALMYLDDTNDEYELKDLKLNSFKLGSKAKVYEEFGNTRETLRNEEISFKEFMKVLNDVEIVMGIADAIMRGIVSELEDDRDIDKNEAKDVEGVLESDLGVNVGDDKQYKMVTTLLK